MSVLLVIGKAHRVTTAASLGGQLKCDNLDVLCLVENYHKLDVLPGIEPMSMVGANRVLGVEVNFGRQKHIPNDDDNHAVQDKDGGEGHRSSAVQVILAHTSKALHVCCSGSRVVTGTDGTEEVGDSTNGTLRDLVHVLWGKFRY